MGNYGRDDSRGSGGYRGGGGGFSRGGGRGGFGGGRPSFGGARGGDREMFSTICSNCGKECQVPFKPTNGKPVYCSDCFEKMGNRSDRPSGDRYPSNDRPRFDDRARQSPQAQSGPDLGAINAKLDKILNILEPKVVEAKPEPKTVKVAEVVDLPKIKKAVKKVASKKIK
jgi:CxxC-x17-CxxC domain-containing protein